MKRTDRFRTLKGTIDLDGRAPGTPATTAKRLLILDDGLINIGYRITSFRIFNSDMTGFNDAYQSQAHLAMNVEPTDRLPRADDNREIAWAAYSVATDQSISHFNLIDPDHIIVRDLYFIAPQVSNTTFAQLNYFITMEEYDITDIEAVVSIIKENSQALP